MPIVVEDEEAHKVVVLGPRGAPTKLLEHCPTEWEAQVWKRADGQGEPGEPLMDWLSFYTSFIEAGTPRRAYFFGHGIDEFDLVILGAQTKAAVFRRIDHLVLALDDSTSPDYARPIATYVDASVTVCAVGLSSSSPSEVEVAGRRVPVVCLAELQVADWLRSLRPRLVGSSSPR